MSVPAKSTEIAKASLFQRLKALLSELRSTFKEGGFKGVINRYGWKIFAFFFAYYLIRDLTLYVFIPWIIARQFIAS